ncbi:elongation factor G-1, mitochondrial isoform X2 [Arachis hypogaea]|uniref:elongation factor G-1, mitochondrial isoform X2 n=1 Tax=Arachis hypogaea TaxID=3818 RepID=UPI003B20F144
MGTKNVILRKPKFIHWNIYKISILLCDSAMIVLQYSFYGNVMLLSYRRALIGHPVENLRVVLTDGATHAVDSSELAFKLASIYAFRQCYTASRPVILELVILVELKVPTEFQGAVAGDINKRKGVIVGSDQEGDDSIITAHFVNFNSYSFPLVLWLLIQYKLLILLTLGQTKRPIMRHS